MRFRLTGTPVAAIISQKDHAESVLAGDHRPRIVNFGSFESPRYIAWTPTREGPPRPDWSAAHADLLDMLVPTTGETPGAHRDELTDELIGLARKWVERESRNSRWLKQLGD